MCGRYVQTSSPAALAERFHVDEIRAGDLEPDYNVAPRRALPVVVEEDGVRVLERFRWGFVPSWAKDPSIGDRMINARAETVAVKPAFRRAFARRRCIVPADGFYEWRTVPARRQKQPYFILGRDRLPLAFAGLWETRHDPADPDSVPLRSFAIITTDANAIIAPIHDRMPALLAESSWDAWLDHENDDSAALSALLQPAPEDALDLYAVSVAVSNPRTQGPELIERVLEQAPLS